MTLGRLALAWLPVAVWFLGVRVALSRWTAAPDPEAPRPWRPDLTRAAGPAALEALLLALLASLWFDSLGSGEWWLPVGLVGGLVAMARVPRRLPLILADLGRYVGAGALLAWRLRP